MTVRSRDREFSRLDRVAATVQRVLAHPVGEIARSLHAGLVTITHVDVSPDLRRGVVYLSVFGTVEQQQALLGELRLRAGELQAVLGRELRTRRTPVLTFREDDAIARADRIQRLLGDGRA